jgi:hypothetical protein
MRLKILLIFCSFAGKVSFYFGLEQISKKICKKIYLKLYLAQSGMTNRPTTMEHVEIKIT